MTDQGLCPTDECILFKCQKGFDDDGKPIRPRLVLRGIYWCCPDCGSSYGEHTRRIPLRAEIQALFEHAEKTRRAIADDISIVAAKRRAKLAHTMEDGDEVSA